MALYFPYLRDKRFEVEAVADAAYEIVKSNSVVPIFDPVRFNRFTKRSFPAIMMNNLRFCLIVNPTEGYASTNHTKIEDDFLNNLLYGYTNWLPSILIDTSTTANQVSHYLSRYTQFQFSAIFVRKPSTSVLNLIASSGRFIYNIYYEPYVRKSDLGLLAINTHVKLCDNFNRRGKNALYPSSEGYTNLNTHLGNPHGEHWGDFSIVGDNYTDGGGASAQCVAIHVVSKTTTGALIINHYLSDDRTGKGNIPRKILQALSHLTADLPNINPNSGVACRQFQSFYKLGTCKELGSLKKFSIIQNIECVL